MKKSLLIIFGVVLFSLVLSNKAFSQGTSSVTINYTGYTSQCCSSNSTPYYCFNDNASGACGGTQISSSHTFTNPIPAGYIVTGITANYYTAGGVGSTLTGYINGVALPPANQVASGFGCGSPWTVNASSTSSVPCGLPAYNNGLGASNTFLLDFGGGTVCISKTILLISYAPASQSVAATAPGTPSGPTTVCPGSTGNIYSVPAVANAASYLWTVTGAGWSIVGSNTGTSVSVTAGSATGTICCQALNACGNNQSCVTVNLNSISTAPTSASANPTSVCPGGTSTLTVAGGSLGTGAAYTWHSGSCAGTVVGTGTSVSVSPSSTTTYYVNVVGTCNTTACVSTAVTIGGTTPTPGLPSGTTSPCGGTTQTYNTTGSTGATSYTWTVPAGSTINSGQGTTSISVTLGSTTGNVCVTATGACGVSAAACTPVTITNVPTTPGTITGQASVCIGSYNYSISAVGGATGYSWATTGGGTITNGNTTTATINWTTPGTYTVSAIASNTCGNSTQSTLVVTVNPPPTITINSSTLTVCSGSSATFTASGASTYTWTPATVSPTTGSVVTATPLVSPTVYTVNATDGNGCVNANTISINVNPTPTVSISGGGGNSQTVCGGGLANSTVATINFTVSPTGSVVWTNTNTAIGLGSTGTGSIGSYPAPNITSGTSTTAVITATATSSSGCATTNNTQLTYTLTINQIPGSTTATINPASCGQNDGTITGPTGTGGSGFYSYSWDNGGTYSSSSTYTNGAGTYPVWVKDNTTGCIYSQNFTIPNAGAPAPPTVTPSATAACVGSSVTLTVAAPVAGTTYSWTPVSGTGGSGNSFSIVIPVGAPNPFTIGVTATASGCTGTAGTTSITVNQPPVPVISSSTNGQVCAGSTITLTVTPAGSNYSYQWGNSGGPLAGATSNTLSVGTAGTYSVLVTDNITSCSAITSGNGTVTVNSLPVINTSSVIVTQSSCVVATGSITNVSITGTPAFTYAWTSGTAAGPVVGSGTGANPTLTNVPAGAYCLSVMDGNTCTANFCSISVTNAGAPPQPVLTATVNDTTYCQGDNILPLVVTVANTGTATPTVNWYSDAGLTTVLPGGSNTSTYTPSGIPVGVPTTIYVAASAGGCVGTSRPVTITINPTPIGPVVSGSTTATNSYCQGLPIGPLTVLAPVTTPTTIAVWYNSAGQVVATGNSYTPTSAGVYTVLDSVGTNGGCKSSSLANGLQITVIINPSPSINVSGALMDTAKCGQPTGGVHGIANATGGTPLITYQWYNGTTPIAGQTSPNLTNVTNGGAYNLQVTDGNGCHALGTGTLGVNTFTVPMVVSPVASFSTNPDPPTGGVPITVVFTNQTVGTTTATTYVWNFGDGPNSFGLNATHTYTAANTYSATLTAYNGPCASTPFSVVVIANVPTTIIIPNIFTPNGDSINDQFFIVNTGMASLNCQIFNRWGQLLFTITAPNQSWDGNAPNGDKAPEGTYMYILQAQGNDGKTYKQNGTLTLAR